MVCITFKMTLVSDSIVAKSLAAINCLQINLFAIPTASILVKLD